MKPTRLYTSAANVEPARRPPASDVRLPVQPGDGDHLPANNVTYTYGAASQRNPSASGNVVGRITHITDRAGTEDRLYGRLGEITQETRAIPIQGNQVAFYVTNYTYDTWNRMVQMQYPIEVKKLTTDQANREVVPYFYDFGGLPERVHGTDDALEADYASAIAYDRLSMTYGNSVVTTYAHGPDNRRLLNVQATLPVGYTGPRPSATTTSTG
jgi:hypothetical protein